MYFGFCVFLRKRPFLWPPRLPPTITVPPWYVLPLPVSLLSDWSWMNRVFLSFVLVYSVMSLVLRLLFYPMCSRLSLFVQCNWGEIADMHSHVDTSMFVLLWFHSISSAVFEFYFFDLQHIDQRNPGQTSLLLLSVPLAWGASACTLTALELACNPENCQIESGPWFHPSVCPETLDGQEMDLQSIALPAAGTMFLCRWFKVAAAVNGKNPRILVVWRRKHVGGS